MDVAELIQLMVGGDDGAVLAAVEREPALAAARNEQGVSVICLATYRQRGALAKALAARRADLDVFEACCVAELARVRLLLDAQPGLRDAVSPDGFSPLGFSAFFGHVELLRELLARGADVHAASRNAMRVQPLHSAAAQADHAKAAELSRLLLQAGADPNAQQQGGFTPLHEAALNGKLALIALLLAHGASCSLQNDRGQDALELARSNGDPETQRLLEGVEGAREPR